MRMCVICPARRHTSATLTCTGTAAPAVYVDSSENMELSGGVSGDASDSDLLADVKVGGDNGDDESVIFL